MALALAARLAQPESTFGSPDTLVDRGTAALAREALAFGKSIAKRCKGKTTPKAIRAAIDAAARAWPRRRFAEPVDREMLHGQMLGALDADFELWHGETVAVETFSALHREGLLRLLREDEAQNDTDPAFAKRPQVEAVAEFESRQVVTRDVFDQMDRAAQRRAFTVANAATRDIAATVKRELVRQVQQGAELRDFSKHALARLESAGWTPQNPSHAENVLRTNALGAYNSGRYRQMTQPNVLRFRPYWQILTVNDGPPRQRPTHQAVHGLVLRADDPLWRTCYPPFGYQCRCRVRSLSQRQAEALGIVTGASIRNLPDPGFASGMSGLLDVPPVPPIPPMDPANDTLPPPARKQPKPRKPRAPRKPRPAAEGFAKHQIFVAEAGNVPEPMRKATLRGIEKAGLGKGKGGANGFVPPLRAVEMTDVVQFDRRADVANSLPRNTGGVYFTRARQLRIGMHDRHVEPFLWRQKVEQFDPTRGGNMNVPANSQNIAQTREEVVEMTACHEYAHHIHMSTARYDIKRADPDDAADVIIDREFNRGRRELVSRYSDQDRYEFFAEALTAYRYYPREWMRRHTPNTLRMVRKVLKLKGLK